MRNFTTLQLTVAQQTRIARLALQQQLRTAKNLAAYQQVVVLQQLAVQQAVAAQQLAVQQAAAQYGIAPVQQVRTSNGSTSVRIPKPDSLCGKAWALMDSMPNAALKQVLEAGVALGLNPGNIKAERTGWKKARAAVQQ